MFNRFQCLFFGHTSDSQPVPTSMETSKQAGTAGVCTNFFDYTEIDNVEHSNLCFDVVFFFLLR